MAFEISFHVEHLSFLETYLEGPEEGGSSGSAAIPNGTRSSSFHDLLPPLTRSSHFSLFHFSKDIGTIKKCLHRFFCWDKMPSHHLSLAFYVHDKTKNSREGYCPIVHLPYSPFISPILCAYSASAISMVLTRVWASSSIKARGGFIFRTFSHFPST